MSDKTIDEVAPDTNVTGIEKIPVSDGGTPKSMTVSQVKDFVISKISEITGASGITIASDGVFIKSSGVLKPIDANKLADAIIQFAFAKGSPANLSETDVVSIGVGGSAKSTTIGAIAAYVRNSISHTIDIAGLPDANELYDSDLLPVSQTVLGEEVPGKTTLDGLKSYVISKVGSSAIESTETIGNNDSMLIISGDELKKVTRANAGLGNGDVSGPASSLDGGLVVFNGTTGKAIKGGLTVVTTINSSSTNSHIPTANAVRSAIASTAPVSGPESSTDEDLVQFDGTTGKAIKGGLSVVTSVTQSSTDSQVPTALAVATAISSNSYVSGPATSTDGNIAQFDGSTGKTLKGGYSITDTITSGSAAASRIPTAEAVINYRFVNARCCHFLTEAEMVSSNAAIGSVATVNAEPTNFYYKNNFGWYKIITGSPVNG